MAITTKIEHDDHQTSITLTQSTGDQRDPTVKMVFYKLEEAEAALAKLGKAIEAARRLAGKAEYNGPG